MNWTKKSRLGLAALSLSACFCDMCMAAGNTLEWNKTDGGNLNDAVNWGDGSLAPTADDYIKVGTTNTAPLTLSGNLTVKQLFFATGAGKTNVVDLKGFRLSVADPAAGTLETGFYTHTPPDNTEGAGVLVLTNGCLNISGGIFRIGSGYYPHGTVLYVAGENTAVTSVNVNRTFVIGDSKIVDGVVRRGCELRVTDGADVYLNPSVLEFGKVVPGHEINVLNGGHLTLSGNRLRIGFSGSVSNSVNIAGTGSSFTFSKDPYDLSLGYDAGSSDNAVNVTDHGLLDLSANGSAFMVGASGSRNRMNVSSSAQYLGQAFSIGNKESATDNVLDLYDNAVLHLTNSRDSYVGNAGAHNVMKVRDGAVATTTTTYIGNATNACGNLILVDNTCYTNTLGMYVGNFGSSNKLVVCNGARALVGTTANKIYVGQNVSAVDNEIVISNATFSLFKGKMLLGEGGTGSTLRICGTNTLFATNIGGPATTYGLSFKNKAKVQFDIDPVGFVQCLVSVSNAPVVMSNSTFTVTFGRGAQNLLGGRTITLMEGTDVQSYFGDDMVWDYPADKCELIQTSGTKGFKIQVSVKKPTGLIVVFK